VRGYNIYRATDAPVEWKKLNRGVWRGHFWRDQAALEEVSYDLKDEDWAQRGGVGMWGFKLPDTPYSNIVETRPLIATSPNDVSVEATDTNGNIVPIRPAAVISLDQTVWLPVD